MGRQEEALGRTGVRSEQRVDKNSLFDKLINDENLQEFLTLVAYYHIS